MKLTAWKGFLKNALLTLDVYLHTMYTRNSVIEHHINSDETLNPFIPQCQISLTPVDNPHYRYREKELEKKKQKKRTRWHTELEQSTFERSRHRTIRFVAEIPSSNKKKIAAEERKKKTLRTHEAGPLAPGPCRSWLGWLSKAWKSTVSASKWKGRLWRRHLLGYRLNFIGGTCQQFAIPPPLYYFSLNCW